MKTCSTCKEVKSFDSFAKATSTKDLLQRGCRECKAKKYQENKGRYKAGSRAARVRRFNKLAVLKDKPCKDRGVKYHPTIMEFDHVEDNKVNSIAKMMTTSSWQAILDEVAKCDLVCANCHRMRTYNRLVEKGSACHY